MGPITSLCCSNDTQSNNPQSKRPFKKKKSPHIASSKHIERQLVPIIEASFPSIQNVNLREDNSPINGDQMQEIEKILKPPTSKKMKWSDFIIRYLIGTGGFGEVFLGELKENKEKGFTKHNYAIKRMKKADVIKKRLTESIRLEKKILEESSCNFITRLFYAFRDDYYLYIVMEWAEGGDTYTLIRPSSPRIKMFKSIGENALRFILGCLILGLEYLHSKQIIYRDLKPENLLIFGNGYVKLTDFGLARELKQNQGTKTLAGTTVYYAPEMVMGYEYGREIDLWTLGVYAYEMSNFSAPFAGADIGNKTRVKKLVQTSEVSRTWKNPGISNQLKSFIDSLLKYDPKKRLGAGSWQQVKSHSFFTSSNFDWKQLQQHKLKSPLVSILRQFKMDYKPYDAVKMNPEIKLILPEGSKQILPSWSVCQSSKNL